MTVATEACAAGPLVPVAGVPIALNWPLFATTDVTVQLFDLSFAILNVDFTITLAPPGYATATLTPATSLVTKALAAGGPILITRDTAATQGLTIPLNTRLNEAALERELDRNAMRDAELQERCRRLELTGVAALQLQAVIDAGVALVNATRDAAVVTVNATRDAAVITLSAIVAAATSTFNSFLASGAAYVETAKQWAQRPYGEIVDGTVSGRSALHYSEISHQYATDAMTYAALVGGIVYDFGLLSDGVTTDDDWGTL